MLTYHSKIFERIMFDQLSDHFETIFNTYLAQKGFWLPDYNAEAAGGFKEGLGPS